jgi:hypothetical protein
MLVGQFLAGGEGSFKQGAIQLLNHSQNHLEGKEAIKEAI